MDALMPGDIDQRIRIGVRIGSDRVQSLADRTRFADQPEERPGLRDVALTQKQ
jgi:hypothetical protein